MSLFTPKLITNERVPMDLNADTPHPLATVFEATEESVRLSTDRPIRLDKLSQRPSSPYTMGRPIGTRINESAGRRQASPRPRDKKAYVRSLATRAAIAFGYLDDKITTNKGKLGDLGGRIQGLAGEMQDMCYHPC